MTTLVRPATIADGPRLSQLGANTFRETFEGENTPDDMARYLTEAFTAARHGRDQRHVRCRAACRAPRRGRGGEPGRLRAPGVKSRASRSPGPRTDGTQAPLCDALVAWEGCRPSAHGRRPGRARARGAKTLWLGVWERNERAVALMGNTVSPAWASIRLCSAPTHKPTGCWPVRSTGFVVAAEFADMTCGKAELATAGLIGRRSRAHLEHQPGVSMDDDLSRAWSAAAAN